MFLCIIQLGSPFGQLDTYKKLEALGEGSYATVYKVNTLLNCLHLHVWHCSGNLTYTYVMCTMCMYANIMQIQERRIIPHSDYAMCQ